MTEAAHQMTSNPLPPRHRKAGSVGVGAGLRVRIIDKEGNDLGNERRGEVAIMGANVFRGYDGNPEANAKSFVKGWFRTGDEGWLDRDCYLHLSGRIKDIIIRGGENIAPHEVDEILLEASGGVCGGDLRFCASHAGRGSGCRRGVARAAERQRIGAHQALPRVAGRVQVPKKIYLVKSIPTTATGKIRRSAVADALVGGKQ